MPSFDIVSKPSWPEIDNALNQAGKELAQRFDFKGTDAQIEKREDSLHISASTEDRVMAALGVLQDKLVKRKVSLRFLDVGDVAKGPKGTSQLEVKIQEGVVIEKAREIVKLVKDSKIKVQAAIQEDMVRVSGKNKDDLQEAMKAVRAHDFGIEIGFINFRD